MTTESTIMMKSSVVSVPTTPAFPTRESPMLMVYLKPKATDRRRTALNNED